MRRAWQGICYKENYCNHLAILQLWVGYIYTHILSGEKNTVFTHGRKWNFWSSLYNLLKQKCFKRLNLIIFVVSKTTKGFVFTLMKCHHLGIVESGTLSKMNLEVGRQDWLKYFNLFFLNHMFRNSTI